MDKSSLRHHLPDLEMPRAARWTACVLLVALCSGGWVAEADARYREAPQLARLVAEGKLPPVEQRIPENPLVVEPVERIGKYGGYWRRLVSAPGDMGLNSRLGYETPLRWDRTGMNVVPGLAERYEMLDDARVFVFHLRKGLRWSDGHPFTSDDFIFAHQDILQDPELTPSPPAWLVINDKLCEMEAPDPYTVIIRFEDSYGSFPDVVAFRGRQNALFAPRHYLSQFHRKYADPAQLEAMVQQHRFLYWNGLFGDRMNLEKNPDCPTMAPFVLETPFPAMRPLARRNPYYWKIDPAGKQLPYLDGISYSTVFDKTVLNLKAINGEVDYQDRHINPANYTLFMEARREKGYRVLADAALSPIVVYVNQYSRDESLRSLLQDRRFRIALSKSINRAELIELIYSGLAEPSNGTIGPGDPYYTPGLDSLYADYDPEEAARLLDELGMERGRGGLRRLPDGRPFRQILHVFPSETGASADMWQLVVDYWREVGLQFVVKLEDGNLSGMQVRSGNSDFWAYTMGGLHWSLEGVWRAPTSPASYYAPLYGHYFISDGKRGVQPPPEHQRLVDWYLRMKATPDPVERLELGRRTLQQWAEECYTIGVCRPVLLTIVSNRFRNVPLNIRHEWSLMSPGYIGIEQFFIDEQSPLAGGEPHQ